MTARTIAVVSAGLGQPSSTSLLASRLATSTTAALADHGQETQLTTIELRPHAHDLTDNLLTGFASHALQAAKDAVTGADGLIAISPIYSASYTGLFKTFFDLLDKDGLRGTPVLLGATAGTARHSLALEHAMRPLFAHLGALTTPTAVFAATEDWGNDHTVDDGLIARIRRASDELAGLLAAHTSKAPANPFTSPTPFDQLLNGR